MAPFNQRQIGYIQAIAGRQQHVTLLAGQNDGQLNTLNGPTDQYQPQTFEEKKVPGPFKSRSMDPDSTLSVWSTSSTPPTDQDAKVLLLHTWNLDSPELAFDSRNHHNDDQLNANDFTGLQNGMSGMGASTDLEVFSAPVKGSHALLNWHASHAVGDGTVPDHYESVGADAGATGELVRNQERIPSSARATPDGYLNSTDIKFRFTLPGGYTDKSDHEGDHPMGQDHYEFRWIVWRHKKPTMNHLAYSTNENTNLEAVRDGASFRHPGYDFFKGQTGRKRGFLGYTLNPKLDSDVLNNQTDTEAYSGMYWDGSDMQAGQSSKLAPTGENGFTVDDLLTMRINRDDYVVMKDVRFFLGKQYGKSHFEDHLHWDWNDPIDTVHDNVLSSPTLNNKNYRWHMTLIGTNNGRYNNVCLNHSVRWTTKMESG